MQCTRIVHDMDCRELCNVINLDNSDAPLTALSNGSRNLTVLGFNPMRFTNARNDTRSSKRDDGI